MKFQNHILKLSLTGRSRDGQTDEPKAICPFNFFKVGGIKIQYVFQGGGGGGGGDIIIDMQYETEFKACVSFNS